jgi:NodT family efflux transporter outer membrane factor (OMF) lipoprotein
MTPARMLYRARIALAALSAIVLWSGCTSPREYVQNGLKVGPNYCRPAAPVAEHWIDEDKVPAREGEDLSRWWKVFNDPVLDRLIGHAYRQNLSLREAGFRVLEARAQRGIAVGELFPQQQNATGSYRRQAATRNTSGFSPANQFFDQWNAGFNLAWELDFWGRFRRAVAAADAQLDASVEGYDDVLVTLLADVASNYVQVRTLQERIRLLEFNVALQQLVFKWTDRRSTGGKVLSLDVYQIESTLEQTAAQIPELEIQLRFAENRLCILLGMPPTDLRNIIGEAKISDLTKAIREEDIAFGIPAELLRRRPDVRRAERLAAAQSELIGIAQADLYPAFSINGTLGYQAKNLSDLLAAKSLNGNVGPSFQWNILNYGRIINNVRLQDAKFQELATTYQDTVLRAGEEAEDGLVTFLRAKDRAKHLDRSAEAGKAAVREMFKIFEGGRAGFDFSRYALIQQNLVQQDDLLAQSYGEIAQGLIQVYRAMGGGWEIRLAALPVVPLTPAAVPSGTREGAEILEKLRRLLEPEEGVAVPDVSEPPAAPAKR